MSKDESVLVMHVITGLHVGGAEKMLVRLLGRTNHRCVVVSLTDRGAFADQIEALGIPVHALGMKRNFSALKGLVRLRSLVNDLKPTLIQSWLYAADFLSVVAAFGKGIPVLWNIRQSETGWIDGQKHIAALQRVNALLSRWLPAGIVYCAEAARDCHEKIGYRSSSTQVISNGVDTEAFRPDSKHRESLRKGWLKNQNDTESAKIIGIVGRDDPLKNHDRFIRVVSALKTHLPNPLIPVMVGLGMDKNNAGLIHKLRQAGIESDCHLLGLRDDVSDLMNAMDLVLLTSSSEGWPNVVGEAMACGCICVSSDVGDVRTVTGDAGWVVSPVNDENFVAVCLQAMNMNQEETRQMGMLARRRIENHFSVQQVVNQYDALHLNHSLKAVR